MAKNIRRGDQGHRVPKVLRDPGDYERGEVVNGGQGTPPEQPGHEWAGNSPGWQGMPRPLGDATRGRPISTQDVSHAASHGPSHPRGPNQQRGREVREQDYTHPDHWAGNDYGVPDEQEQLGHPEPITKPLRGDHDKFNK